MIEWVSDAAAKKSRRGDVSANPGVGCCRTMGQPGAEPPPGRPVGSPLVYTGKATEDMLEISRKAREQQAKDEFLALVAIAKLEKAATATEYAADREFFGKVICVAAMVVGVVASFAVHVVMGGIVLALAVTGVMILRRA